MNLTGPILNTSAGFAVVSNREQVTLYDNLGNNLGSIQQAKRLMQDNAEKAPSHGEYLGIACDWRLPKQYCPSGEILPGFKIVDQFNVAFTIQDVDPPGTYQGTWNCYCLSLRVMGHTITIKTPANATDSYASPLVTLSSLAAQPAAIQEVSEELINFQRTRDGLGGVHGLRRYYNIWILTEPRLVEGTIITDERGYLYQLQRQINRRRLDELVCLECIINP